VKANELQRFLDTDVRRALDNLKNGGTTTAGELLRRINGTVRDLRNEGEPWGIEARRHFELLLRLTSDDAKKSDLKEHHLESLVGLITAEIQRQADEEAVIASGSESHSPQATPNPTAPGGTSAAESAKAPTTVPELIWRVATNWRLLFPVIAVLITAILYLIRGGVPCPEENATRDCTCPGGAKGGQQCSDHHWTTCDCHPRPPPPVPDDDSLRFSGDAAACIERARELKKPYAILAATLRQRVEDVKGQRRVDFHTTYTLFPLREIVSSETTFKEEYSSGFAKSSIYFPGSEREISHGSGSRIFDVVFDAKAKQPRSITTGTVYLYDLPLKRGRPAFASTVTLNERNDHLAYPNENDVICEITLIVESEGVKVIPEGQAAKRVMTNRAVLQGDVTVHEAPGGFPRTLIARWLNVSPGEEVGIEYTW
jgi:hypothetical protein